MNHHNHQTADVPKEVTTLIDDYLSALQKGAEYSIKYMHFENDFIRQAYLDCGDKLVDYQIESIEKINENLYVVTLLMKSEIADMDNDSFKRCYNFVANIDDQWYYLNGVAHIPADLQENLDPSKYTPHGENIVDPGDVIGPIDFGT